MTKALRFALFEFNEVCDGLWVRQISVPKLEMLAVDCVESWDVFQVCERNGGCMVYGVTEWIGTWTLDGIEALVGGLMGACIRIGAETTGVDWDRLAGFVVKECKRSTTDALRRWRRFILCTEVAREISDLLVEVVKLSAREGLTGTCEVRGRSVRASRKESKGSNESFRGGNGGPAVFGLIISDTLPFELASEDGSESVRDVKRYAS